MGSTGFSGQPGNSLRPGIKARPAAALAGYFKEPHGSGLLEWAGGGRKTPVCRSRRADRRDGMNHRWTRINTDFYTKKKPIKIIGCAMEVLNTVGHGLLEKLYENALVVEFDLRNIPYQRQSRFDVIYKSVKIGEYIPDLIVFNQIVVDAKTIERITNHEKGQILNYLKITGLRVGLILNFKYAKLQWGRIAL
jgi:GxxExxY protein